MRRGNISIFVPHMGCPQNCSFCNQKTISGHSDMPSAQDVQNAVLSALSAKTASSYDLQIAFFGGSFTAIDKEYQKYLLEAASPFVKDGTILGIRISTRPDCIDEQHVLWLKDMGVTDIELGAQCMDDTVLALNDRGHTVEDVKNAVAVIKKCGVNVGLQMMCGLYGSSAQKDIKTAQQFVELAPSCVRIYPTITLKGTKLYNLFQAGEYTPDSLGDTVDLCAGLLLMFHQAGIPVIRLGLHDDESLKKGYAAGPMHPALGELVQSRIYKKLLQDLIQNKPKGMLKIRVNAGEVSKLAGHQKENRLWLQEQGYALKVIPDKELPTYFIECED